MIEVLAARRARGRLTLAALWAIVGGGLPAIASLGVGISTIDLAYQVRAGRIMLATGDLVAHDPFAFTTAGRPWLNQQWGAQILFAWVYGAGSWLGLALLRAALLAGTFRLLYDVFRRRGLSDRGAAALCVAVFVVGAPGLGLRPQTFGLLLFALVLWLLDRRARAVRGLLLVPPLIAVWANLHGSFPLGLVLLGLALLEDLRARADTRRWALWSLVAGTLATFVNPFGPDVWRYAIGLPSNPQITGSILEWQPPTLRSGPGVIIFASFFLVAWLLARRGRLLPGSALIQLALFAGLALIAIRGMVWWALGASPVVASLLRHGPGDAEDEEAAARPEPPGSMLNTGIAVALAALAVVLALQWRGRPPLGGLLWHAPVGLTRALEGHVPPGTRLFNAQIWGSWLEFAAPEYPVAVDARIELFPPEVWRRYYDASTGHEGWEEILDDWDVGAVVAEREQQARLIPLLRRDPTWRLVYQDEEGALFVRAEGP